nr:hypothetical protein Q903MT_gene4652 [Picea sitchensis]
MGANTSRWALHLISPWPLLPASSHKPGLASSADLSSLQAIVCSDSCWCSFLVERSVMPRYSLEVSLQGR